MISLYNKVARDCSELITKSYSTSFTLGIRMFHSRFRPPIYSIYGFVRFADEIVDTMHDQDKSALLGEFTEETNKAIDRKFSTNPVIHSFQEVVNKYKIEWPLIQSFLDSMRMDLTYNIYNRNNYERYIHGSAEVVGLMCLRVFCEGDEELYSELKTPAQKLGAAFQKVNFLRDMKSDFDIRERIYFPGVNFDSFDQSQKTKIESEIKMDFSDAYEGIKKLPDGVRLGVYLAYIYYNNLLTKIESTPPREIKKRRLSVNNGKKAYLLLSSAVRNHLNLI